MSDREIDYNREKFNAFLSSGMDAVAAYQLAYDVSNEEAIAAIKKDQYDYLVQSGISESTARKIILEDDNKIDKTI